MADIYWPNFLSNKIIFIFKKYTPRLKQKIILALEIAIDVGLGTN